MSLFLILGIITFAFSSAYFITYPKKPFNSALLVSFVTLSSYIVMLQGSFVTDGLYWTRWLVYGISCPLLCYEISKRVGLETPKIIFNIFLTFIVMVTGALASVSLENYKITFFGLSTIAFGLLIKEFYQTKSQTLKTLTPYIIFGWSAFPLVFIFSNEGIVNLIPVQVAGGIYLILDIFTKIIFYIHHNKKHNI